MEITPIISYTISTLIFCIGSLLGILIHSNIREKREIRKVILRFFSIILFFCIAFSISIMDSYQTDFLHFLYVLIFGSIIATLTTIGYFPDKILPKFNETSLSAYILLFIIIIASGASPLSGGISSTILLLCFLVLFLCSIFWYHSYKMKGYIKIFLHICSGMLSVYFIFFLNKNILLFFNYFDQATNIYILGNIFLSTIVISSLLVKSYFIIPIFFTPFMPLIKFMSICDYYRKKVSGKKMSRKEAMSAYTDISEINKKILSTMRLHFGERQIIKKEIIILLSLSGCIYLVTHLGWISIHGSVLIYLISLDIIGFLDKIYYTK